MNPQEDLFQALRVDDFAKAEQALAQGANINYVDPGLKTTLFHHFMTSRAVNTAKWLVERGADVNAVDNNGDTVLMPLIERNQWNEFAQAMALKVDVNIANLRGITPVLRAALFRHGTPFLKELLAAGAEVNVVSNSGTSPLLAAVSEGFLEMAKDLFEHGASPLGVDEHGQGIFYSAAVSQSPKMMKLVLEKTKELRETGALDVNYAAGGSSAIALAAMSNPDITLMLLRAGANPNDQSKNRMSPGMTPLMILAHEDCSGEALLVKEALAAGASPNIRDHNGNNVVLYALSNGLDGKHAVLEALLEAGLDPKAPIGPNGASPFHIALKYQGTRDENGKLVGATRAEIIEILLEMGFPSLPAFLKNENTREENEQAPLPLILALAFRDLESSRVLIEKGQPLNELDAEGLSVLHRLGVVSGLSAKEQGMLAVFRSIHQQIEAASEAMKNAPEGAVKGKVVDDKKAEQIKSEIAQKEASALSVVASAAQVLSEAGADWNLRSKDGLTPAMTMAKDNGHLMLGQVVRFHGADLGLLSPEDFTAADFALAAGADKTLWAMLGYLESGPGLESVRNLILNAVSTSPEIDHEDSESFAARDSFVKRVSMLPAIPLLLEHSDASGNTPLIIAAATGQDDLVRTLLAMGADPNAQNNAGETALLHAVKEEEPDIVRLLRAAGGDPELATRNGSRATDMAQARTTRMAAALRDPSPADMPTLPELSEKESAMLSEMKGAWNRLEGMDLSKANPFARPGPSP